MKAADALEQNGFTLKSIKAIPGGSRRSIIGWSATMDHTGASKTSGLFKSFGSSSSLSYETAMNVAGIPQHTLLKNKITNNASYYIVVVYGPEEIVFSGSAILRLSSSLEMDFYQR